MIGLGQNTHLKEYLTEEHGKIQGISIYRSYIIYRESAPSVHGSFDPVSEKTFRSRLKQLPPEIVAYAQGGKRLANSVCRAI